MPIRTSTRVLHRYKTTKTIFSYNYDSTDIGIDIVQSQSPWYRYCLDDISSVCYGIGTVRTLIIAYDTKKIFGCDL